METELSADALRIQYMTLVDVMLSLNGKVDAKLKLLEEKERKCDAMLARVKMNQSASKAKIRVNVGGKVFEASRDVFLRHENSYFHALLGSTLWKPDKDGMYFIDRDPEHFGRILESLRSSEPVDCKGLPPEEVERLRLELDYYQLPAPSSLQISKMWDTSRCSRELVICEAGKTITHVTNLGYLRQVGGLGTAPNVPSFQVRLGNLISTFAVGYAKGTTFEADNVNLRGNTAWLLTSRGDILVGGRSRRWCPALKQGDVITVRMEKPTISFTVNGTDHGPTHTTVDDVAVVYPCVVFFGNRVGTSLTIVE